MFKLGQIKNKIGLFLFARKILLSKDKCFMDKRREQKLEKVINLFASEFKEYGCKSNRQISAKVVSENLHKLITVQFVLKLIYPPSSQRVFLAFPFFKVLTVSCAKNGIFMDFPVKIISII